jgi:hypothetical protein
MRTGRDSSVRPPWLASSKGADVCIRNGGCGIRRPLKLPEGRRDGLQAAGAGPRQAPPGPPDILQAPRGGRPDRAEAGVPPRREGRRSSRGVPSRRLYDELPEHERMRGGREAGVPQFYD